MRSCKIIAIITVAAIAFTSVATVRNEVKPIASSKEVIEEVVETKDKEISYNFCSEDLTVKSNLTIDKLDEAFDKIGQPQMKDLSLAIIDSENFYGVNAFFMAGLIAQESGYGKYPAGDGTNLTGYAVYTSSSNGTVFKSRYDNIIKTAELIAKDYLSSDGEHYNGKSTSSVNIKYCLKKDGSTDYNWSNSINEIAMKLKGDYDEGIS